MIDPLDDQAAPEIQDPIRPPISPTAPPPPSQEAPVSPEAEPNPYEALVDPQEPIRAPRPAQPAENPYGAVLDELVADRETRMLHSFLGARVKDPAQAGEAQRLAAELGLPASAAEHNLDEVKKALALKKLKARDLMVTSPTLARQLADPQFASVAHDLVEELTVTERMFRGFVEEDLRVDQARLQELKEIGKASPADLLALQTIEQRLKTHPAPSGFASFLGRMASRATAADLGGMWDVAIGRAGEEAFEAGRLQVEQGLLWQRMRDQGALSPSEHERLAYVEKTLQAMSPESQAPGFVTSPLRYVGQLSKTIPPSINAGLATGGLASLGAVIAGQAGPQAALPEELATVPAAFGTGFLIGSTSAMATLTYATESGHSYRNMVQAGLDPVVSKWASRGVGGVNAALEVLSAKMMAAGAGITADTIRKAIGAEVQQKAVEVLSRPTWTKALAQAGRGYLKGAGTEIGTEELQAISDIVGEEIARYGSDAESQLSTPEGRAGIVDRLVQTALETAYGMSVLAAPGPIGRFVVDAQRAKRAEAQAQFWDALGTSGQELRARSAGAHEQFLAASATDGTRNAYIDGKEFVEVLRQADEAAAAQGVPSMSSRLEATVPGLVKAGQDAAARNQDLAMPTSVLGSKIAGTELYDPLKPHLRLDPAAMSMAQAQVFKQEMDAQRAEAERILEQAESTDSEFADSARGVETAIADQLVAAGRTTAVAKTEARLYRDMLIVLGRDLKMLPHEVHGMRELKVRAGELSDDGTVITQGDGQVDQDVAKRIQQRFPGLTPDEATELVTANAVRSAFLVREGLSRAGVDVTQEQAVGEAQAWLEDLRDVVVPQMRKEQAARAQQALVQSPAFKTFFRESKIVDEQSQPQRVYHGSGAKIDEFRFEFTGQGNDQFGSGFYFTTDRKQAEGYTGRRLNDQPKLGGEDAPTVVEAYLSIQNPLDADADGEITPAQARQIIERAPAEARRQGLENWNEQALLTPEVVEAYATEGNLVRELFKLSNDFFGGDTKAFNTAVRDVLGYDGVVKVFEDGTKHVVAFFPEQVKSTGNQGTFDPASANIFEQRRALTAAEKKWANWEPARTADGKILGAPEWVQTDEDLATLRAQLRSRLEEGEIGRYWYEVSTRAVMKITGGNKVEAERLIQLIAIYSPNNEIWVNLIMAIRAYTHWKNGGTRETLKSGMGALDQKAVALLYDGEQWDGRKTQSFYLNLMHEIVHNATPAELASLKLDADLLTRIQGAVTADVWMYRTFGYRTEQGGDDKARGKYTFVEGETRRLAARANMRGAMGGEWTPHQAQAAMWTAMKTRYEIPKVKEQTNAKSMREGLIREVVDEAGHRSIEYPATAEEKRQHLANWRHFAMGPTMAQTKTAAAESARSFADDLGAMAQTITWEALPSPALNHPILKASPEVQQQFTEDAVRLILSENREDLIAAKLGVALGWGEAGQGSYEGAISPNRLTHLLPARKIGQPGFSREEVRLYAQIVQAIFKQKAVPWMRPDNRPMTDAGRDEQAFRVISKPGAVVERFASREEADAFALQDPEQRASTGTQQFLVRNEDGKVLRVFDTQKEADEYATAVPKAKPKKGRTGAKTVHPVYVVTGKGGNTLRSFQTQKEADTYVAEAPGERAVRGGDMSRGAVFTFAQEPDAAAVSAFYQALKQHIGPQTEFTRTGANEFLVVNFRDDNTKLPFAMTDEDFIDGVALTAKALPGLASHKAIYVDGEYGQTQDWAADGQGESLLRTGSLGGRPDLHAWVRDRQSAFDALLASYATPVHVAAAQRAADVVAESRDEARDAGDGGVFDPVPDAGGVGGRRQRPAQGDRPPAARERRAAARIEAIRLGTFDDADGRYATRTELVEDRKRKLGVAKIETTEDLAAAVADIGDAAVEHFYGVVTDAAGKPLALVGNFKGEVAATSVPRLTLLSEAFRVEGGRSLWLVHNHPSGSSTLSEADVRTATALSEATRGSNLAVRGIMAVGGTVPGVGRTWAWSGPQAWTSPTYGPSSGTVQPGKAKVSVPVVERVFKTHGQLSPDPVTSPEDLKRFAATNNLDKGVHLVLMDAQNRPTAIVPMRAGEIGELRQPGRLDAWYRALSVANGAYAAVVHDESMSFDDIRNMLAFLQQLQVTPLDVLSSKTRVSWSERSGLNIPTSFRQGDQFGSGTRGFYQPKTSTIWLTKTQNGSTFLHELSHHYLELLADLAGQKLHPRLVDDMNTLLKWFGVEDLAAWRDLSFERQKKHHEQFARSFEVWLWEGKAPSRELESIFARVSRWIRQAYRSIAGAINAEYRKQFGEDLPALTPEVRQVMGRMFASADEVAHAEAVHDMAATFETQEESGMDDAAWAEHEALVEEASTKAEAEFRKATLKELGLLTKAHGELLRDLQKQYERTRERVGAEVEQAVRLEPVYRARKWIETGELVDRDGSTAIQLTGTHKLHTESVASLLPPGTDLSKLKGRRAITADDGLLPDTAARLFDFQTGEELVQALLTAQPIEQAVATRTDAVMMAEHSELADPKKREQAVLRALHNEARGRLIATDLRQIGKALKPVRLLVAAAREQAVRHLGQTPVGRVSAREHALAEARSARDFTKALKAGDIPASVEAQKARLLQHEMVKVASQAMDEIDDGLDAVARFGASDKRLAETRDIDLIYVGRTIATKFGLAPELNAQEIGMAATGRQKVRTDYPAISQRVDALLDALPPGVQSWREMPMDLWRDMIEIMEALWDEAYKAKTIELKNRRELLEDVVEQGMLAIAAAPGRTAPGSTAKVGRTPAPIARLVLKAWNVVANLKRFQHWAWFMDGAQSGWFDEYMRQPLQAALGRYWAKRAEVVAKIHPRLKAIYKAAGPAWDADIAVPEAKFGDEPLVLRGKKELLGLLQHMGNESSQAKALVPYGFAPNPRLTEGELVTTQWDQFLARMFREGKLTQADVDYVRFIWETYESLLPEDQKTHKKLYGFEFKTLELKEVSTPWGTLRGGYVPAYVDQDKLQSPRLSSQVDSIEGEQQNYLYSIGTGKGHTLARNPNYMKPLALDVTRQVAHIDAQLRFTYLQPTIAEILRIVRNHDWQGAMGSYDREAVNSIILPMLDNAALQAASRPSGMPLVDAAAAALRTGTSMAALGFNVFNSLLQLTGMSNATSAMPARFMLSGIFTLGKNRMGAVRSAMDQSPFMRERLEAQTRKLRDEIGLIGRQSSGIVRGAKGVQQAVARAAFWPQRMLQGMVDVATWHGAYQHHIAQSQTGMQTEDHLHAAAVAHADGVVARTQGSNNPEDQAAYASGTPLAKLLTQFADYSNTVLGSIMGALPGKRGRAILWALIVPALAEATMRAVLQGVPDDDDDGEKDLDEIAMLYARSVARNTVGLLPGAGPILMSLAESEGQRVMASPASTMLQQAWRGAIAAGALFGDEDATAAEIRAIGTVLTVVTGLPIVPITRALSYQRQVETGRLPEPTGPADYARGLLIGR